MCGSYSREVIAPSLHIITILKCRSGDLAHASKMFSLMLQLQISKTKRKGKDLCNEKVILHCLIMAQRRRLVNILSKTAPLMDGQREAIKRETADMQMEKGEKI